MYPPITLHNNITLHWNRVVFWLNSRVRSPVGRYVIHMSSRYLIHMSSRYVIHTGLLTRTIAPHSCCFSTLFFQTLLSLLWSSVAKSIELFLSPAQCSLNSLLPCFPLRQCFSNCVPRDSTMNWGRHRCVKKFTNFEEHCSLFLALHTS